ncbi:MAG: phosphoglycerate kinase [bacterium]
MEQKRSIEDVEFVGKCALVRVDFNVPLDGEGNITDDSRIRAALPTINHILDEGGKVILMSHLGRPKGQRIGRMSLRPVARRLSRLLRQEVVMAPDCIGEEVRSMVDDLPQAGVILLENLRFHPGEAANDPEFAKQLAQLGDVYVDDAFATAHRNHASVIGVPEHLSPAVAGFLMWKEINYFIKALATPFRPLAAVLGGAKVTDKTRAIEKLVEKVDKILLGGGMAFTFLTALGYDVGKSLVEENVIDLAREIMENARERKVPIYLPVDSIAAEKRDETAVTSVVTIQEFPENLMGLDIGPATIVLFREALADAKTIVWNGPMGVFELSPFNKGTFSMIDTLAHSNALTILGGGDTDTAVHTTGKSEMIDYISTGGGAFLKLLEQGELPGINALQDK